MAGSPSDATDAALQAAFDALLAAAGAHYEGLDPRLARDRLATTELIDLLESAVATALERVIGADERGS